MNDYLLYPHLHKRFGDRLISILGTVHESLRKEDADIFPVASAMRAWTKTWQSMELFSDRHHFKSTLFISRISILRDKLQPMSKLLTNLCLKLEHHVIELLAREGTVGNKQCCTIIHLCISLLRAGSLMHSTCLTLGSSPELDLDQHMQDVNKQVDVLRSEALRYLAEFEGSFLVKAPLPPIHPVSLVHVRAWVALFTLASSFHIAISSQPQQLITVLMEDHPTDQLMQRTKKFIRCLQTLCTGSEFGQTTEHTLAVRINNPADKKKGTIEDWEIAGRHFGPSNSNSRLNLGLNRERWNTMQESKNHPIAPSTATDDIQMHNWPYEKWVKFSKDVGLTNEQYANPDTTRFKPWQAPRDVFVGAIINDMIEAEKQQTMGKHKDNMATLLRQNNQMNISPEQRRANEETIMNLYTKAEQNNNTKLPMHPDKLDQWMRTVIETRDPIALQLDRKRQKGEGSSTTTDPQFFKKRDNKVVMPPMDDFSFLQDTGGVNPEALVETIKSQLHGDFNLEAPKEHLGPPPLIQATKDLLGNDFSNTMAVVLTSAGPSSLPSNVRALAPLVCVSMLIYPTSDKLLGNDNFMTRLKECSQTATLE